MELQWTTETGATWGGLVIILARALVTAPLKAVAAAAAVVVGGGGVLRWTEEVVAVGDRIIGDRRIRWSGYDLEDSYGPALYEHEKMRKWD